MKLALHWKILIGMLLGILYGIAIVWFDATIAFQPEDAEMVAKPGRSFVVDWIKPFGTIFINVLKMIAIPLIVASLVKGVSLSLIHISEPTRPY